MTADACMIAVDDSPAPDEVNVVHQGLREFNREQGGLTQPPRTLKLFVRDPDGRTRGGLLGYTVGTWLHIETLWLDDAIRRKGYGRRLMERAEADAIARGCRVADLTTFDFQSPRFYEKRGYELFAELQDVASGHSLYFFRKSLTPRS